MRAGAIASRGRGTPRPVVIGGWVSRVVIRFGWGTRRCHDGARDAMGETGDAIARARDGGDARDDVDARASRVSLASS